MTIVMVPLKKTKKNPKKNQNIFALQCSKYVHLHVLELTVELNNICFKFPISVMLN